MVRVGGRTFTSAPLKLSGDPTVSTWLVLGRGRADVGQAGHTGRGTCPGAGSWLCDSALRLQGRLSLLVSLKCCQIPAYDKMWYFIGLLEDLISRC